MPDRTVEDRLREEYFGVLPQVRRVIEHLEAEIRYRLLPISRKLERFERLEVHSRIKDCESAVESLRRRQEGAIFYPDRLDSYTLTMLKDLAGVRVLAFPVGRITEIDAVLRDAFNWTPDAVTDERGKTLAFKYFGHCEKVSDTILGEYQIASVLTGLFWTVEHSAIYKPSPDLKGVARSLAMKERAQEVVEALNAFEDEFERLIRSDTPVTSRHQN